jgi:REase_MTES_1575
VRDRDRLRGEHLQRLGWSFHRLWSTNWFQNPQGEMSKLQDAYQRAVAAATPAPEPAQPEPAQTESAQTESAPGKPQGASAGHRGQSWPQLARAADIAVRETELAVREAELAVRDAQLAVRDASPDVRRASPPSDEH